MLYYSMYYLNHAYQRLFSFCHAKMIDVYLLVEYQRNIAVFSQIRVKGYMLKGLGVHQLPFRKRKKKERERSLKLSESCLET